MESLNPPSDITLCHNQLNAAFGEMREVFQRDDFDFLSDEELFRRIGDDTEVPAADVVAKYEHITRWRGRCIPT
jgi:hypothetical protein